jgi:YVTN family beta-propeller protein
MAAPFTPPSPAPDSYMLVFRGDMGQETVGMSGGAVAGKKVKVTSGYTAYASTRSACVVAIDTKTDSITDNICAASGRDIIGPWLVMSPDGKKIYSTGSDDLLSPVSSKIFIIDTTTRKVTKDIIIGSYSNFANSLLAISPDGKFLYVTSSSTTLVIDTATDTVVDSLTLPIYSVITKDGAYYAYAIDANNPRTILVIDIKAKAIISTFSPTWQVSNTQGQTVTFQINMSNLGITPNGSRIYATGSPTVTSGAIFPGITDNTAAIAIDTGTNTIVGRVQIPNSGSNGSSPSFAFSPDGQRGYLVGLGQPIEFDTVSNTFISRVNVSFDTATVAITPDGKYGYSAWSFYGVSKFDTATNAFITQLSDTSNYLLPGNIVIGP